MVIFHSYVNVYQRVDSFTHITQSELVLTMFCHHPTPEKHTYIYIYMNIYIVSNQKSKIHVTNIHMSSINISIYFDELLKTCIFPTHFHPHPPFGFPLWSHGASSRGGGNTDSTKSTGSSGSSTGEGGGEGGGSCTSLCSEAPTQRVARWKWISREKLHRKHHGLDEWILENLL